MLSLIRGSDRLLVTPGNVRRASPVECILRMLFLLQAIVLRSSRASKSHPDAYRSYVKLLQGQIVYW